MLLAKLCYRIFTLFHCKWVKSLGNWEDDHRHYGCDYIEN